MFTLTIKLDSIAIYLVAMDVIVLLSYILYIYNKKRLLDRSINSVKEFIEVYFMNTGAEVQVTCFKLQANKHFVVLIQSQALKRFRCSNILETNLISHILDATGNVVEKIYWRFPVKLTKDLMAEKEKSNSEADDLYFSDGYAMAEAVKEYKVSELSWDQYQAQKK